MGVLPLQFKLHENAQTLGLKGDEIYSIKNIGQDLYPGKEVIIEARSQDNSIKTFSAFVRLDTPKEIQYYLNGGIMNTILAQLKGRKIETLQN